MENQEFAESRNASSGNSGSYSDGRGFGNQQSSQQNTSSIGDGFMNIPDGVEDEGLPFN